MRNKLNIDDQVKINMPGVVGDGSVVTIVAIQKFNDKILYTGTYHQDCSNGGEGFENSIQFGEGQYEIISLLKVTEDANVQSSVRCKMKCVEKGITNYGGDPTVKIALQPVDGNSKENKEFFKWTPSGKIDLAIINEKAASRFEPGKDYFVDFTPAE